MSDIHAALSANGDSPLRLTVSGPCLLPTSLRLRPGDDRVWVRHEPDGSVTLIGAEPAGEGWQVLQVHQPKDAPTMTVNIPVGDPDDPSWTDLDVREWR